MSIEDVVPPLVQRVEDLHNAVASQKLLIGILVKMLVSRHEEIEIACGEILSGWLRNQRDVMGDVNRLVDYNIETGKVRYTPSDE